MAIDVHGHITSPALFARFPMPPSLVDVDGMVEQKAACGITTTVVGSPVGAGTMVRVPGLDNYTQPRDALAAFHDHIAEQARARPGRLAAYAYTNPYGGDRALEDAAALLARDEFVGLIVNSSVDGEFLDAPRADDFFAMAAGAGAPVMLHPPAEPAGSTRLRDPRLVEHVARPCDVALGVAALVFAGWLEKYPQLRVIAPVAGGGLPVLVERLDTASRMPRRSGPPRPRDADGGDTEDDPVALAPPRESLRRVYVDTATSNAALVAEAVRVLGVGNVLLGTDTPPMGAPLQDALDLVAGLGLPEEDAERIRHGNAAGLFKLEGATAAPAAFPARGREHP